MSGKQSSALPDEEKAVVEQSPNDDHIADPAGPAEEDVQSGLPDQEAGPATDEPTEEPEAGAEPTTSGDVLEFDFGTFSREEWPEKAEGIVRSQREEVARRDRELAETKAQNKQLQRVVEATFTGDKPSGQESIPADISVKPDDVLDAVGDVDPAKLATAVSKAVAAAVGPLQISLNQLKASTTAMTSQSDHAQLITARKNPDFQKNEQTVLAFMGDVPTVEICNLKGNEALMARAGNNKFLAAMDLWAFAEGKHVEQGREEGRQAVADASRADTLSPSAADRVSTKELKPGEKSRFEFLGIKAEGQKRIRNRRRAKQRRV